MAKCLCSSLSIASSSSAFVQTPAFLLRAASASPSAASVSGKCAFSSSSSVSRIVAKESAGVGSEAQAEVSSRRRILGFGLLTATGLAAGLSAPSQGNAAPAGGRCEEFTVAPSGLAFCDTSIGSGIEAQKGMLIKAHYTGKLENGTVFDSSYNRGKPLTFRVGVGEVIRGWDQGIQGAEGIPAMLAGGKRTLRIPSNLAYGERGAGCRGGSCIIPPNSTLIFDVEFVGKA
ncbi:peptidylprolyl isomerase [Marchantia polymorpha subsp. ruderalis]|nr:hypothetical protein MARPO_0021s0084 [Marchantia polymorpha]BBN01301.1 hypothetical protein Mp_2g06290 [Marchantia polymorpha subsp. ruderalis]CCI55394.1 immunophilin FKBP13 [Marchantia polymorpha]|eukprot:PTQ44226.1 hypothetical protein MARPO_0021s0084 [Marchantia polymorpha]